MASELTEQQAEFCRKYIECKGNASEAYRQSYDCANSGANTIWVEASRLLDNPMVALRIEELQEEHRIRHMVTVDSLTEELNEAKMFAYQLEQTSAAVSAIMGKAKIHGFDKTILGGEVKTVVKIVDMSGKSTEGADGQ